MNRIWDLSLLAAFSIEMEPRWATTVVGNPTQVKKRGGQLKPAHSDPLIQAKREKERLAKQGKRERAAQRAAAAEETGVASPAPTRGPSPLPDSQVTAGHRAKRARKVVKAVVAAVTAAGLPDFASAAVTMAIDAETMAAENAATELAAAEKAAAEAAAEAQAEAAIEAAAMEAAAAEVEAAMEQAAASVAAERAEAIGAAVEDTVVVEQAEAERLRLERLRRLAQEVAPTAHGVAFATELRVAPACGDDKCAICLEEPCLTRVNCCGKAMHADCLRPWLTLPQVQWPQNYGEHAGSLEVEGSVSIGPDGRTVINVRPDGRAAFTEVVVTKKCPWCRRPMQSLTRAGLGR